MKINNPLVIDHILASSGEILKFKIHTHVFNFQINTQDIFWDNTIPWNKRVIQWCSITNNARTRTYVAPFIYDTFIPPTMESGCYFIDDYFGWGPAAVLEVSTAGFFQSGNFSNALVQWFVIYML